MLLTQDIESALHLQGVLVALLATEDHSKRSVRCVEVAYLSTPARSAFSSSSVHFCLDVPSL